MSVQFTRWTCCIRIRIKGAAIFWVKPDVASLVPHRPFMALLLDWGFSLVPPPQQHLTAVTGFIVRQGSLLLHNTCCNTPGLTPLQSPIPRTIQPSASSSSLPGGYAYPLSQVARMCWQHYSLVTCCMTVICRVWSSLRCQPGIPGC